MFQKLLIFIYLAFLGVACAPPKEVYQDLTYEASYNEALSSSWVKGKNAFPLKIKIAADFNDDEGQAIKDVASNWNDSINSNQLFQITESSDKNYITELNQFNDNTLGIYKIYNWDAELPSSALAVTQIYGNKIGNNIEIYHADILVNYDNFEFSDENGFGHDLQTVIVHELGHFLGLYHEYTSTDETIMYPSISRYTINRIPKFKDVDNIIKKYNLNSYQNSNEEFTIEHNQESTPVVIRQELMADGNCKHKLNGKVIYEHKK